MLAAHHLPHDDTDRKRECYVSFEFTDVLFDFLFIMCIPLVSLARVRNIKIYFHLVLHLIIVVNEQPEGEKRRGGGKLML